MCRLPSVIPLAGLRVAGLRAGSDVVRLEGELDLASRGMLCSLVGERPARDIRIDASGLEFVDCAGLAALLELAHRTRAAGHRFDFTAVSQPLSRLAQLTGTTTRLLSAP
jgi:anti-anti-sigma factor